MSQGDLTQFLARLQAAGSDEERSWLVMQRTLDRLSPATRQALWAAAIPHWFDADFLAALLPEDLGGLPDLRGLLELSFVEPFPDRGHNLHEGSRALLLRRLWDDDPDRYRELSRRAAAHCARQDQADTGWRVETLYHHLLSGEPGAVDAFVDQGIEWHNSFEYNKLEVLTRTVLEAVGARRLTGRAAAWAYYRQAHLDIIYNRYRDARVNLKQALEQQTDNQSIRANCIQALGDVHLYLAEYEAARERYEQALPVYRGIGDQLGAANCIRALGDVHRMLDEYEAARERYEQALPVYRGIGDQLGAANCIKALGDVHLYLAEYEAARERYEGALTVYRGIGAQLGAANCIQALGDVHYSLDEYEAARERYEQALPLYRGIGSQLGAANCIKALGDVHYSLDEYEAARERYEQALTVYRGIGDQVGEINCLFGLADLDRQAERWGDAEEKYRRALTYYREIGMTFNVALTLQRLGHTAKGAGDPAQARDHYRAALELFTQIGSPVAKEVQADLDGLDG